MSKKRVKVEVELPLYRWEGFAVFAVAVIGWSLAVGAVASAMGLGRGELVSPDWGVTVLGWTRLISSWMIGSEAEYAFRRWMQLRAVRKQDLTPVQQFAAEELVRAMGGRTGASASRRVDRYFGEKDS